MTNYLETLSKEETEELLNIIGGNYFKGNFVSTPREFSKLKPGFRPDKVTNEDALKLATKNIDRSFIITVVNSRVDSWLKEISSESGTRVSNGLYGTDALASTLLDSFFKNDIDLYFKLRGGSSPEEIDLIKEKMETLKKELKEKVETMETKSVSDTAVSEEPAPEDTPDYDTIYKAALAEKDEKNRLLSEANDELKKEIESLKEKLAETEKNRQKEEEENARRLAAYDDSETDISLPEDYTHMSLCEVTEPDYNGQIWLTRLGDIESDGRVLPFFSGSESGYFEGRERLFFKNGPSLEGSIGIWNWSTIPNKKDPTKDYVLTDYNTNVQPIEVIPVPESTTVDDLVRQFKAGIQRKKHSGRMLITAFRGISPWLGLLCTDKDIRYTDGCIILRDDVISLPLYKFGPRETTTLGTRKFYWKLTIGTPGEIVMTKDPLEIVKAVVCDSITWQQYKDRGIYKTEWRNFKDYISSIRTDSVISGICEGCKCSESEAEELLAEFMKKASDYLDGSSLDDDVIRSAIGSSSELMERSKDLVRKDWVEENVALVSEAENNLKTLQEKALDTEKKAKEAGDSYAALLKDKEALVASIKEKEKLAEDVETGVSERIRKAKENAADFIAEMTFASSGSSSLKIAQTVSSFFEEGKGNENGYPDENSKWEDVLATISAEFEEAGVKREYSYQLAAYIYSAYILRIPLLLAGPNADDIINAFSMSLCAKKAGSLFIDGEYCPAVIDETLSGNDAVVCIHNPFETAWISKLPAIINNNDKYFMISYPYAEDVRIEPKSLYNYVLPLFTEFFIEKPSTGSFIGGIQKEDFHSYKVTETKKEQLPELCKTIGINAIARYRIQNLLSAMSGMLGKEDTESALVFSFADYAYATMQTGKLAEWLSDNADDLGLSASVKEKILLMLGEGDD